VIYAVYPPKFGNRGFADVTARLDEIQSLGANTLWMSPIAEATPGDYGYEVTNHTQLRPEYGTEAELRALVAAAHSRGMKVLLDAHVARARLVPGRAEARRRVALLRLLPA